MRLNSLVIPSVLIVAVGAAYAAGRFVGGYDADQRAQPVRTATDGQQGVEILSIVNSAIGSLEQGKVADAHKVLVRYARLQVPRVRTCAQSDFCKFFAGRHLQSADELERVEARDEDQLSATR